MRESVVNLEMLFGTSIVAACERAAAVAVETGCAVNFTFNGVKMTLPPGQPASEAVAGLGRRADNRALLDIRREANHAVESGAYDYVAVVDRIRWIAQAALNAGETETTP